VAGNDYEAMTTTMDGIDPLEDDQIAKAQKVVAANAADATEAAEFMAMLGILPGQEEPVSILTPSRMFNPSSNSSFSK
jgi:hypothetical protein